MAVEAWSYKRDSLAAGLVFLMRTAPIGRPQCAARVRGDHPARGDQGFESRSLQRGVCLTNGLGTLEAKGGFCGGLWVVWDVRRDGLAVSRQPSAVLLTGQCCVVRSKGALVARRAVVLASATADTPRSSAGSLSAARSRVNATPPGSHLVASMPRLSGRDADRSVARSPDRCRLPRADRQRQ
jgi:hypothetical protein